MKYIELELVNGKRIALENDCSKIYNAKEKLYTVHRKISFKFPFIISEKIRCTSFRYKTYYETVESAFDPKYTVKCSLRQLMNMFGMDVVPFEQAMIESDLKV